MNMRGHQPKPLPPGTPRPKPPTGGSAGERPSHDCPVCRSRQHRIDDLEERVERLTQIVQSDHNLPPHEWSLGPQETAIAERLARGPAHVDSLRAVIEAQSPRDEMRSKNHVRVVLHKLRRKLSDYGWIISYATAHSQQYRIHPEQQSAFTEAMRGEGSHAYPAMNSHKARGAQ